MIDTLPELSGHDPDSQCGVLCAVVDQRHLVAAADNLGLQLQEPRYYYDIMYSSNTIS